MSPFQILIYELFRDDFCEYSKVYLIDSLQVHWHADYNIKALTFFISFVDVPLIIGYLTFYCNEQTKYAVVWKLLNLAGMNSGGKWVEFVDAYVYHELEEIEMHSTMSGEGSDAGKGYDVANLIKVVFYQVGYIFVSPLLGEGKRVQDSI